MRTLLRCIFLFAASWIISQAAVHLFAQPQVPYCEDICGGGPPGPQRTVSYCSRFDGWDGESSQCWNNLNEEITCGYWWEYGDAR